MSNTQKLAKPAQIIRCIRNGLFTLLIILYILFEELIWKNAVGPIIRYIAGFHLYRQFLDYVRFRAGRFSVLILFMLPFALGEAVGTGSALMAAQLHLLSAAILYTLKIPLIVISLGILQNGKEKLLSYQWFALCYGWTMKQIDRLHSSRLYRQIYIVSVQVRNRFKNRSSRLKRRITRIYHQIRHSVEKKSS